MAGNRVLAQFDTGSEGFVERQTLSKAVILLY